ncbi:hypothetical protein D3C83_253220 [compost metagenome]
MVGVAVRPGKEQISPCGQKIAAQSRQRLAGGNMFKQVAAEKCAGFCGAEFLLHRRIEDVA